MTIHAWWIKHCIVFINQASRPCVGFRYISRCSRQWPTVLILMGIFYNNSHGEIIFVAHFDRGLDADYASGSCAVSGANSSLTSGNAGYPFKDSVINEALDLTACAAYVSCSAVSNICLAEGTVSFWLKPMKSPVGKSHHVYFALGEEGRDVSDLLEKMKKASFRIEKPEGATWLRATTGQFGKSVSVDISDWNAVEWHHIVVTWCSGESPLLTLYIDGYERASSVYRNMLDALSEKSKMWIGFPWRGWGARAVVDEFLIYNVALPRAVIKSFYDSMNRGYRIDALKTYN